MSAMGKAWSLPEAVQNVFLLQNPCNSFGFVDKTYSHICFLTGTLLTHLLLLLFLYLYISKLLAIFPLWFCKKPIMFSSTLKCTKRRCWKKIWAANLFKVWLSKSFSPFSNLILLIFFFFCTVIL